ncbi:hypothetical protein [Bordetella bronchiseptica]|uniref:Uncharacterized protein n=1 Tax=Bordetella bronchiseptica (strain ATCC BAA-588 / NCTC 13252 / RB50) TaxID=257310 RepID=A0A0H3LKA8_BORBR|nr:hypothetical protein [Bordetella bronchiseptica]AMG88059.1 hypothetical protein AL472_09820 [Bordetella bronchiseptica]CAE32169.1 phage-related hypothetical protein [Bordetella bronchiseptica RB50]
MSRSGYNDDGSGDPLSLGRWRGMVASALRGKRGQAFLRELAASLDGMPEKRLIAHELKADGQFCTLGVLGAARGIDLAKLDPEDYYQVADAFGIAPCMAQEVVYENDEAFAEFEWVYVEICGPVRPHYPEYGRHRATVRVAHDDPPAMRWRHMRAWVQEQIDRAAQQGKGGEV